MSESEQPRRGRRRPGKWAGAAAVATTLLALAETVLEIVRVVGKLGLGRRKA